MQVLCLVLFLFFFFSPTLSFSTTKFVEWFPQDLTLLRHAWTGPCQTLYDDFVYRGQGQCGNVLNCLLEHGTSELRKTTIASAQVTLGLIPFLLTCVGTSVPEVSLLASRRPLLTLLLMVGSPGLYPTRVMQYENPLGSMQTGDTFKTLLLLDGGEAWATRRRNLVIFSQYILAIAVTVNNLEMSLRLGSRSVLSWGCRSWYMPMVWVLFTIPVYGFAAISCCIARGKKTPYATKSHLRRWIRWDPIEEALLTCLRSTQAVLRVPHLGPDKVRSIRVMIWQAGASCLAVVQTMLGNLILSSLVFVGFHDTLIILARFLASALVSRLMVLLQLHVIDAQMIDDDDDAAALTLDRPGRSHKASVSPSAVSLKPMNSYTDRDAPTRPVESV